MSNLRSDKSVTPRVLFVTHRFHPNLREAYHAIKSGGGECMFVVSRIGPSEPEELPDRVLVTDGELTADYVNHLFATFSPNVVVQREFAGKRLTIWRAAGQREIPRFLYDQNPVMMPLSEIFVRPFKVGRMAKDFLLRSTVIGRHSRISPVLFWGRKSCFSLPGSHHVAFPMRPQLSDSARDVGEVPRVVCIAKHGQARKRVAWLIRALAQAPFDFSIRVIGSSPTSNKQRRHYKRLQKLAQRLGEREDLVQFESDLTEGQIHAELRHATVFVLPARREQMAISPLEAMAHALPILIASDGGAVSYISPISENQIFRTHSRRDFQRKLERILTDQGLRTALGTMNAAAVGTSHSPALFWRRIEEVTKRQPAN